MTIDELKRALVEVRELCAHTTKCVACPLHKNEKGSTIPYCPLYEDMYGMAVQLPNMWDIDDWKEDSNG